MTEKQIQKKAAEICSFFRYEIPYSRLSGPAVFLQDHPGICKITYEDFLAALKNMRDKGSTVDEVLDNWFGPLMEISDLIGFPEAVGTEMRMPDSPPLLPENPFERGKVLTAVIGLFFDGAEVPDDAEFTEMLGEYIEMMENTLYNEERPVSEWKLSLLQEMRYAAELFENEQIDLADPEYKDLFVRCLNDCCDKGIYDALKIKAFCSCGGNSVYPCDWNLAREYFEILVEETEDPMAANALGHICLNGRTNNGVPEYELAYKYFSYAAFAGVFESMYKSADMLAEGRGIMRSHRAAMNQVRFVYSHTKTPFTDGIYSIAFADAAWRMGNYHRDGIGTDTDLLLAYSYYLDAQTALFCRMRYDQSWGDDELFDQIQDSIADMESRLGNHVHESRSRMHEPALIDRILSGGFPLIMKIRKRKKSAELIFRRQETGEKSLILLTVENMSYSTLKKTVSIKAEGLRECTLDNGEEILFDRVGYDMFTEETIFWYDTMEVGRMKTDYFVYEDDRPEGWQGHEFMTYAKVIFRNENTAEEMICEIPGLKKGDRVLAERNGEVAEGIIANLFKARDFDMEEREYGRVIQKISMRFLS